MNYSYKLILLFFIVFTSALSAQVGKSETRAGNSHEERNDSIPKKQKEKRFFVKFFYSPQLSYRRALSHTTAYCIENTGEYFRNISYRSNLETPIYGYEAGGSIEIKTKHHFNFDLGITFDKQGYQAKNADVHIDGWGDFEGSFSYNSNISKIEYSFQFISVPIIFNYEIKSKKLIFFAGMGIEPSFLYSSSVKIPDLYYKVENTLNSFNGEKVNEPQFTIFDIANVGASIPISKKVSLIIEPYFQYQMLPMHFYTADINVDGVLFQDLKTQLWSAGCKVGIKF